MNELLAQNKFRRPVLNSPVRDKSSTLKADALYYATLTKLSQSTFNIQNITYNT